MLNISFRNDSFLLVFLLLAISIPSSIQEKVAESETDRFYPLIYCALGQLRRLNGTGKVLHFHPVRQRRSASTGGWCSNPSLRMTLESTRARPLIHWEKLHTCTRSPWRVITHTQNTNCQKEPQWFPLVIHLISGQSFCHLLKFKCKYIERNENKSITQRRKDITDISAKHGIEQQKLDETKCTNSRTLMLWCICLGSQISVLKAEDQYGAFIAHYFKTFPKQIVSYLADGKCSQEVHSWSCARHTVTIVLQKY